MKKKNLLLTAVALLGLITATMAQNFTDVTSSTNLPSNMDFWSIEAYDFNNDNNIDIIYRQPGSNYWQFFKNNGDGTFSNINSSMGVLVDKNYRIKFCDFNKDGKTDIIAARDSSNLIVIKLLIQNSINNFSDITSTVNLPNSIAGSFHDIMDFDEDGDLDIIFSTNSVGDKSLKALKGRLENQNFFCDSIATIFNLSSFLTVNERPIFISSFDFDNDNDADILYCRWCTNCGFFNLPGFYAHQYGILRNEGNGVYTEYTTNSGIGRLPRAPVVWDYNNDGIYDLVCGSSDNIQNLQSTARRINVWRGNSNGTFTDVTTSTQIYDGASRYYRVLNVCDFNNDFYQDLLAEIDGGSNPIYKLYSNNNGTSFSDVAGSFGINVNTSFTNGGHVWADFDNDGAMDLFINENGTLKVLKNNINQNNWIKLRLYGCESNADAYGVKVIIKANGKRIALSASEGSERKRSDIHAGLGSANLIDSISIYWHNSAPTHLTNVTPNQLLTIYENTDGNCYTVSNPPSNCSILPANLQNGLVGYWPFCANANDESGNGNNGTVNGATLTTDRFGNANSAYSFNGVNSRIRVNNSNSLNIQTGQSLTISAWVKHDLTSTNINRYIISKYSGAISTGAQYAIGTGFSGQAYTTTQIAAGISNHKELRGSRVINDGNWHHFVYVWKNGQDATIFIDNQIDTTENHSLNGSIINNLDLLFGCGANLSQYYKGSIDDIAIYNRALSQQEIQQLYTGSTVNPNEFTLYLDTIPGINGQQVLMPIRVKNFNNMLSAQFTLQFDPSVISYAGFANAGIPSITGSSFGQAQINNGVLTFAWSQPNVTPVSLADDELLVNLRFNVIGAGGSFSPITFINSPTPIEFVDQTFVPLSSYQTLPGRVDVLNLAAISGNLKTENGNGIRSATVAATGFTSESTQSNLAGQYSLLLPQGQSYTITPTKGNDTLVNNGITTLDVLLIQRHILGILPLNSPYKIIAADVNLSGTVTSADINLINALILANISAYPSGRFWSFVPDNHVFSNPQNPFPFPAARTYNSLNTATNQDFFGMKLGDVNNSYNPALARRARSENPVELYIENQNVSEEATIQVPVRVKNFTDIAGFQFGLQWDASVLRYIEINPANGGLDVNKGETMTAEGKLNINWTEPDAGVSTLEDDGILFNISFEVLGGVGSNTNVDIYSSPTTPVEIYTGELEVADHSLQGGVISVTTPSSILEVAGSGIEITAYPNPFKDFTTLSIQSEVPRMVKLEIYDISGRLINSERITLQQGNTLHQVKVSHASGNYLIVLSDASNGNRLATMKLVKE